MANGSDEPAAADDLGHIAAEACRYFFPLLVMQLTREVEEDLASPVSRLDQVFLRAGENGIGT